MEIIIWIDKKWSNMQLTHTRVKRKRTQNCLEIELNFKVN